jgi:hypothetical protein
LRLLNGGLTRASSIMLFVLLPGYILRGLVP